MRMRCVPFYFIILNILVVKHFHISISLGHLLEKRSQQFIRGLTYKDLSHDVPVLNTHREAVRTFFFPFIWPFPGTYGPPLGALHERLILGLKVRREEEMVSAGTGKRRQRDFIIYQNGYTRAIGFKKNKTLPFKKK